jgi:hypothetical protein
MSEALVIKVYSQPNQKIEPRSSSRALAGFFFVLSVAIIFENSDY